MVCTTSSRGNSLRRKSFKKAWDFIEALESRVLLSASMHSSGALRTTALKGQGKAGTLGGQVTMGPIAGYSFTSQTDGVSTPSLTGALTPTQIRTAYGIDQINFSGIKGDGTGQTIAIIDAGYDPNIFSDLDGYDQAFSIDGSSQTLYQQFGSASTFLTVQQMTTGTSTFSNYYETSLDVEWAHAIAPAAKILLVESPDLSTTNLNSAAAWATAQTSVSVVSMSYGEQEAAGETSSDSIFTTPSGHQGIAFVSSSGDNGSSNYSSATTSISSYIDTNIGSPSSSGSFNTTTLTQTGAGTITGTADKLNFNYASQSGDTTLRATLSSISGTSIKAGIMVRNNTNAGSAYVAVLATPSGISFQYRASGSGSTTTHSYTFASGIPANIAISRAGNLFTAYVSYDGLSWTTIDSQTLSNISSTALYGTAVCSGASNILATAIFNSIDLDVAAPQGPEYQASSPNVIAVGGTYLTVSGSSYSSETAWGNGTASYALGGSGGGLSQYESTPSYQSGLGLTNRGVPDVSFDGGTPVAIYDSYNNGSSTPWSGIGGTSFSAPAWAALIAIADQGRTLAGEGTLTSAQALQNLYALPSSDFHDITTGSNGAYSAGAGYDLVTGLGTPVAQKIAADLANPVQNSGFETGTLASWTSGGSVTVTSAAAHSGTYGVQIGASSYVYQNMTGLQPDTTYQITAYGQATTANVHIYIENYDGSRTALATTLTAGSYGQYTLTFTTGSSNTSSSLVLENDGTSGTAYFDDISFKQLTTGNNLGFESGSLAEWTVGGTAAVSGSAAHSGNYGVQLTGSSYVYQTITGLQPNTTYAVNVYGSSSAANSAYLYIENYDGGNAALASAMTTTAGTHTLFFTTGANNTSVSLVLQNTNSSTTASFDDLNIQQLATANNFGFETGALTNWASGGGAAVAAGVGASGNYAVQLPAGGYAAQYLTGLEPNTTYTVTAQGKVASGSAELAVIGYDGGSAVASASVTSSTYSQQTVTFTTGSSVTAVSLEFYNPAGSGTATFDDLNIQLLSPVANLGFEAGTTTRWTTSGSVTVVSTPVQSGIYAIQVGAGAYSAQTITGLQTNTTYTLTAYAKASTSGAQLVALGYAGGSSLTSTNVGTSGVYTLVSVTFTTDSTTTFATIDLYNGGTGVVDFDNVNLVAA